MTQILHVDASSRSTTSVTRQLSQYLVAALTTAHPQSQVKTHDLAADKPHFVTEVDISAMYTPAEARSPEQAKAWTLMEGMVSDVKSADVYVFGVPMYNFSVPAAFKAFIDLIVLPGQTFQYDASGLKPLLLNKKAFVVTASGGNYDQPPMKQMDFLEPYLRAILGFIGITDITFIKAAGHSEDEVKAATAKAMAEIDAIVAAKTAVAGAVR
jgi:FMN-dependent NADH-azoreductase